jgi:Uma2 family endonuclease
MMRALKGGISMSQTLPVYEPDISHLITEDEIPAENIYIEKQRRLLTSPLYSSWSGPGDGRSFVALANVGVFYLARNPAIVPDMLFSAAVEMPTDFSRKENRSYFLWEFGKPPDIAVEIVSNKVGGEDGEKKEKYARMRVKYYVIFDPMHFLLADALTIYRLNGFSYELIPKAEFPEFNLALTLWEGQYEDSVDEWLRWTDNNGRLILTGKEFAEQERQRADRLAEKLRQMGIDPEKL